MAFIRAERISLKLHPELKPDKLALAFPCRSAAPHPGSSHALPFRFAVSAGAGVGTSSAFKRAIPQPPSLRRGAGKESRCHNLIRSRRVETQKNRPDAGEPPRLALPHRISAREDPRNPDRVEFRRWAAVRLAASRARRPVPGHFAKRNQAVTVPCRRSLRRSSMGRACAPVCGQGEPRSGRVTPACRRRAPGRTPAR